MGKQYLYINGLNAFIGNSGYYVEDHLAIKKGARFNNSTSYDGKPISSGFKMVKQPGSVLSFLLIHNDGKMACGDAMSVQYCAAAGREGVFDAYLYKKNVVPDLKRALLGKKFSNFREACQCLDDVMPRSEQLTAITYGISQAFLMAFSQINNCSMARIICSEYSLTPHKKIPFILCQTDNHVASEIDKMILKDVDIFPHANFNSMNRFGVRGTLFCRYVDLIADRLKHCKNERGQITAHSLHFDFYGVLGEAFHNNVANIVKFLLKLEAKVQPLSLQIETPILANSKNTHWQLMFDLRRLLNQKGSQIKLVIDEWCNDLEDIRYVVTKEIADIVHIKTPDMGGLHKTVEAVLLCKKSADIKAYLGGSSNETDVSARATAHVAIATQPYQVLAKPGMGVDEGIMIMRNEMKRALLTLN